MSSGSGFNHPPDNDGEPDYDKIMVFAIICLILVLLALLLHVYARCIWVQSATYTRRNRRRSASTRRRFYFTGEESATLLNVGLDPAILETLPIFIYRSQNFTDGLECAVCLCELKENEKGRLLPNCGHSFHVDCIDMWFLSHSTCPLCRTGAQPKQPILESAIIEQVSATSPGPIVSRNHDNLNSEQGQTASSEEEYDLQNPTNILSWCRQEQTNADIDEGTSGGRVSMPPIAIDIPEKLDEGTSGGRAVMPHIVMDISKKPDGFWSSGEGHQLQSPNGSQSSSKSPVARLRSLTKMYNRDRERKIFPSDHPCECDLEHDGTAQGQ